MKSLYRFSPTKSLLTDRRIESVYDFHGTDVLQGVIQN